MIDMEALIALAKEVGFTHAAPLDAATIDLKPEVRKMCADNTCGQYGKRWSCRLDAVIWRRSGNGLQSIAPASSFRPWENWKTTSMWKP